MDDIFISYAREDQTDVEALVVALEGNGWSVFWDRRVPSGETWRSHIGRALDGARCVIVVWSIHSVGSQWVAEEAQEGQRRGILVPVMLDAVQPPIGFREIQAAAWASWLAPGRSPGRGPLFDDIYRRLGKPPRVARHRADGPAKERLEESDGQALDRPVNLGFDGPVLGTLPSGWFDSQGHVSGVSADYRVRVVERQDGAPGAFAELSRHKAREAEFGSLMQRVRAGYLAGKTIRYEADLRCDGVEGWAGLWLRIDGEHESDLLFDNMHNRSIRGSLPWSRFELSMNVPRAAAWLNYGVVLSGSGRVAIDNCRILVWSGAGQWQDV